MSYIEHGIYTIHVWYDDESEFYRLGIYNTKQWNSSNWKEYDQCCKYVDSGYNSVDEAIEAATYVINNNLLTS